MVNTDLSPMPKDAIQSVCFVLVLEQQFSQAVKLVDFYWFYRLITNITLSSTIHNVPLNSHKILSKVLWKVLWRKLKRVGRCGHCELHFSFIKKVDGHKNFHNNFTTGLAILSPYIVFELKISSQWSDLRCHFCGPLCIYKCELFSLIACLEV